MGEYVKKRREGELKTAEVISEVKEEVKEEVKRTLSELMRETVELMLGMGELIKDENLFEAMEVKFKIQRGESVKIVSTLMRDGAIYSPSPGYYKITK